MKLKNIIQEDLLKGKEYSLFNLNTGWHLIYEGNVFRFSTLRDEYFYDYEKGKYDWDFASKHITRTLNDPRNYRLEGIYTEFEIEEKIEVIYIDGEKIKVS